MAPMIERRKVGEPRHSYDGMEAYHDDGIDIYLYGAPLSALPMIAACLFVAIVVALIVGTALWLEPGAVVGLGAAVAVFLAATWAVTRAFLGDGFGWRFRIERTTDDGEG